MFHLVFMGWLATNVSCLLMSKYFPIFCVELHLNVEMIKVTQSPFFTCIYAIYHKMLLYDPLNHIHDLKHTASEGKRVFSFFFFGGGVAMTRICKRDDKDNDWEVVLLKDRVPGRLARSKALQRLSSLLNYVETRARWREPFNLLHTKYDVKLFLLPSNQLQENIYNQTPKDSY